MAKRMRRNADFIRVLARATPRQQKGIIEGGNKELMHCICECASNCLKGNVPLKPSQKRKLAKYKHVLRDLADRKVSNIRKKTLVQKGGFLGALLKPIIQTLGSILLN
jgi:hypothetical protein